MKLIAVNASWRMARDRWSGFAETTLTFLPVKGTIALAITLANLEGVETLDLFEYQGKQFFAQYDIATVKGGVAVTPDEAVAVADSIGYPVAVKAQVQVGGRGKAGGIQIAHNAEECRTHANAILGMDIKGHTVHTLWVETGASIKKEYYASFTLDRSAKLDLGMLSAQGGIDIEQVAEHNPDALKRIHLNPVEGLSLEQARAWATDAHIDAEAIEGVATILTKLYRAYVDGDADLVEINPLVLTHDGEVIALDAKVSLDNAAHVRHPEWASFEKPPILDERERMAAELGLQYVGLGGSVGIIANGAGLAMSTVDIVNQVGGSPANFLDVGGGAKAEVVANSLRVITRDDSVKVVFINIFGGITRGEEVAQGIIDGMSMVNLTVPIVVRLDGTNAEQGREIIDQHVSDMLIREDTMLSAARRAVQIAGGN